MLINNTILITTWIFNRKVTCSGNSCFPFAFNRGEKRDGGAEEIEVSTMTRFPVATRISRHSRPKDHKDERSHFFSVCVRIARKALTATEVLYDRSPESFIRVGERGCLSFLIYAAAADISRRAQDRILGLGCITAQGLSPYFSCRLYRRQRECVNGNDQGKFTQLNLNQSSNLTHLSIT